ncbi:hypothetical protein KAFR_0K02300 [Kazachstania africana CBS 2517]|uniref:NAD(+) diphosphatase n=1 Tax=Kazachstania africana (strain ATCC 22294 / BCRC 22015 / CBS 2517 / CECT 1963 / NBRC 1671 / NRRL Y-8276) TaxID=1071382 RepID=H2B1T5_KAZAF|nr:hypothetical protein KAFR_0K02300 [Kazachstania africana CBS 2517]CCF60585.1 hypothetical protein KAFR_0K02300 [Kazachstania africana CBS 2517]
MKPGETFFGNSNIVNRVSFLRNDEDFIRSTLTHDSTTIIIFSKGEAFLTSDASSLSTLTLGTCSPLKEIFAHHATILNKPESRAKLTKYNLVFLGLFNDSKFTYSKKDQIYQGTPYYAIDFTSTVPDFIDASTLNPISMTEIFQIGNDEASLYSHAKMYIDWHNKFNFCPNCRAFLYPVDGGTKFRCGNPDKDVVCNVRDARVNNVCFPRTDPVVIVILTNATRDKICLVRTKRRVHNKYIMYSNVAGFMEPSETIESACTREIWEETGIRCDEVKIILSQPWPYPANLMIGCIGVVDFNNQDEVINLNHDDELMDAQWFDTTDVIKAIDNYTSGFFMAFKDDIYLPGNTAVAFQLLSYVCNEYKRAI